MGISFLKAVAILGISNGLYRANPHVMGMEISRVDCIKNDLFRSVESFFREIAREKNTFFI